MAEDFVIEMLHITKEFPGIKANDDITLQLRKGEVHALLGENGAGKSTLMSVLFGLYQPEQGKILKNGKEVAIRNPNDANALGIGMVHQHFKLVECFSVLDVLSIQSVLAQSFSVKGTVVSAEDNEPMIGVTIMQEGTYPNQSIVLRHFF